MSRRKSGYLKVNFHWQIIALLAAGLLLLALVGSLTAGLVINNKVSALVYEQAIQVTRGLAQRSILPLLSGIGATADEDIRLKLSYPNVKSMGIYTTDFELIAGTDRQNGVDISELLPRNVDPFETVLIRETDSLWVFAAPVYDADPSIGERGAMTDLLFNQAPRLLGYVSVTFDRTSLRQIQQEVLQDNFFIALGVACFILLVAMLVTQRLVKPLYDFIALMRRAEHGDDSVRAELAGPVEIEHMARGFNAMMRSLAQRREYADQQHNFLVNEIEEKARIEKALRKSEHELRNLLAQHEAVAGTIPGIIIEIDQQGRFIWWNRRAEQVIGVSSKELGEMNVADMVPTEFLDRVRGAMAECLQYGKSELHTDLCTPGGNVPYHFNSVRIAPSGDAGDTTVLAIGMDDSESVNAQIALKEARDAALESARVKSEFLANMSHEIRTPMNGMLGMLQLLGASRLDAEQRNFTEIALRSADHLLNIINDVLDFSKIEAGKLQVRASRFSPRALIEDVVELFAAASHEKGVCLYADVAFDIPVSLEADSHRLKQVLSNLVSNAIKFTERGHVLVRAIARHSSNGSATLVMDVIDTGIGIEESAYEQVFESFAQVDGSSTRRYRGTGLGLAIVKRLCELLGATIELVSEPGKGSRFSVVLPLDQFSPEFRQIPVVAVPDVTLVSYFSDDPIQSQILQHYCEALGVPFRWVKTPAASDDTSAGEQSLIFVDIEQFLQMSSAAVWKSTTGHPVHVLVNSANAHLFKSYEERFGNLRKVYVPIRFDAFAALLTSGVNRESPAAIRKQSAVDKMPAPVKPRVLVVEDNQINQRVIVTMLKKLGYESEVAHNGQEAIEIVGHHSAIELVFMDCQMPIMDGYEASRQIRLNEAGQRHISIIAMTGNALEGDREKCINAGMDDYVAKPVRLSTLKDILGKWLPGEIPD